MWFKFPPGTDQISIEQQSFFVEAEDEEGTKFFRAPEHFAPVILSLNGFGRAQPPEGAPEDLPAVDPQRAAEIDQLSLELGSRDEEVQRLRQELGAVRRERDELQTRLDDFEAEAVARAKDAYENEQRLARATGTTVAGEIPAHMKTAGSLKEAKER